MKKEFRYSSGECVLPGDLVRVADRHDGIIEEIISPGTTEASTHDTSVGGLLIAEDWDGVTSYYFVEPDESPAGWEDVRFIARRQPKKPSETRYAGP